MTIESTLYPRDEGVIYLAEGGTETEIMYHGSQIGTLKGCEVDIVWAATINNIPEAVGISRAAAEAGLPVNISFTLDSTHRLKSGPSLKAAIEATDAESGAARPDSYGINCSQPVEFEPALEPGAWTA